MANSKLNMKHNPLVKQVIKQYQSLLSEHTHLCVGLSGGVDSVVLLHLLHQIKDTHNFILSAIHVNHGISMQAGSWAQFCQQLCQKLNIPLSIANLAVTKKPGTGLENTARKFRYQEYAKFKDRVIVLAHHQDDQIETMLSQLMRGSDIHNIAAMRLIHERCGQIFWRPLLDISKEDLLNYAQENKLVHINDDSNANNQYLRNYLRNKILPGLFDYDPHYQDKMLGSLDSIQRNVTLSDEVAASDLLLCQVDPNSLALEPFNQLSSLRQLNLLQYFIRKANLPLPSHRQLSEFCRQVITAKADRHPQLQLSLTTIIKRRQKLIQVITL